MHAVRVRVLTAVAAVVFGCRPSPVPKASPAPRPPIEAKRATADRSSVEARSVNLRMWDTRPTQGAPRKPTFWVHADAFSRSEGDVWSLEEARAVIYGRDEDDHVMTLEAGRGTFQERVMAYLEGGIVARVRDMKLEMDDIEWNNEERVARTDRPLTVESADARLSASSLRLFPDEKQIVMTDVRGQLRFREDTP